MNFANVYDRIKNFAIESKRVLFITRKPSMQEFKIIVKVSAIGMLIIGLVGFVLRITYQLVF